MGGAACAMSGARQRPRAGAAGRAPGRGGEHGGSFHTGHGFQRDDGNVRQWHRRGPEGERHRDRDGKKRARAGSAASVPRAVHRCTNPLLRGRRRPPIGGRQQTPVERERFASPSPSGRGPRGTRKRTSPSGGEPLKTRHPRASTLRRSPTSEPRAHGYAPLAPSPGGRSRRRDEVAGRAGVSIARASTRASTMSGRRGGQRYGREARVRGGVRAYGPRRRCSRTELQEALAMKGV